MKSIRVVLLIVLCLASISVHAEEKVRTFFIIEKQAAKEPNRWSLEEWLAQRDRMRLMDLWLALHSPSPYEFYLGGEYQFGGFASSAQSYNGWNISLAGYASIFGLELQREFSSFDPRWVGLFHLRIFGYHAQATNLTLEGGAKNESRSDGSIWNPLAGVSLTLYFKKFFGVQGLYRYYFATDLPNGGGTYKGSRWEAEAFIDFNFVRIFGGYFSESYQQAATEDKRQGGRLGSKIFF